MMIIGYPSTTGLENVRRLDVCASQSACVTTVVTIQALPQVFRVTSFLLRRRLDMELNADIWRRSWTSVGSSDGIYVGPLVQAGTGCSSH
jgi:hypothetical protein